MFGIEGGDDIVGGEVQHIGSLGILIGVEAALRHAAPNGTLGGGKLPAECLLVDLGQSRGLADLHLDGAVGAHQQETTVTNHVARRDHRHGGITGEGRENLLGLDAQEVVRGAGTGEPHLELRGSGRGGIGDLPLLNVVAGDAGDAHTGNIQHQFAQLALNDIETEGRVEPQHTHACHGDGAGIAGDDQIGFQTLDLGLPLHLKRLADTKIGGHLRGAFGILAALGVKRAGEADIQIVLVASHGELANGGTRHLKAGFAPFTLAQRAAGKREGGILGTPGGDALGKTEIEAVPDAFKHAAPG